MLFFITGMVEPSPEKKPTPSANIAAIEKKRAFELFISLKISRIYFITTLFPLSVSEMYFPTYSLFFRF